MSHTYTNLLTHALFSTKDREPFLRPEFRPDLYSYLAGIINNLRGKPILINGPWDHVHILFVLPSTVALADFMDKLKANSSRWAKESVNAFAWQTGYAAFGVSQSKIEDVKAYIASQVEHHRVRTYQEEVMALLKKHGVEFDERYVI